MTKLRQDQIREMVRAYFKTALDRYIERLNDTGLPDQTLQGLQRELVIHEDAISGSTEISDLIFNDGMIAGFRKNSNLSDDQWLENETDLRREMRKARRDQIRAALSASQSLDQYSFSDASRPPEVPPQESSAPLGQAIQDFMRENSRQWPEKTTKQFQAYLNILIEHFGSDRLLGSITKRDASDVKIILQSLPASRNTKPALKDLPLSEVIKVTGHRPISPKTINSHIGTFHRFFDWAERHGHAPHKLFEGMKVPKAKDAATDRRPFTTEQTQLIYAELTENKSGLVRKDSHKWGALLCLFTGARLNEICQLEIADIQEQDGIWFLNITDEGDAKKSVKAKASRRKVPLHTKLIELGFLEFVEARRNGRRLFPDYSYNTNGG